jgi:signal peptidase I
VGGVVAVGLVGLWRWVATPFVVVGDSMAPTLRDWDLCWMRRTWSYEPRRGDIVVFRTADAPPLYFVKRVVGLPGERIACRAGQVLINGEALAEPYATPNPDWELAETEVPAGKVYVIGDNRRYLPEETLHGLVAVRWVQSRLIGHWRWRGD